MPSYIRENVVGIASFASRILADVIALGVTWVKTVRQVRLASSARMGTGLSGVLLRDGDRSILPVLHYVELIYLGSIFFVYVGLLCYTIGSEWDCTAYRLQWILCQRLMR